MIVFIYIKMHVCLLFCVCVVIESMSVRRSLWDQSEDVSPVSEAALRDQANDISHFISTRFLVTFKLFC